MRIDTQEQLRAAQKAIDDYNDREAKRRIELRERQREELLGLIGDLGGNIALADWARQRHEAAKEDGIGRGMTEASGINWHLTQLARSLRDVCDAFGVDPQAIKDAKAAQVDGELL